MRYVTLFPECERVHLKKDVGMLPYSLNKLGYETQIVCYDNGNIDNKLQKDYQVSFIDRSQGIIKDFSKYLIKNAKNIDVLNIYHITSRRNAIWILIYKLFNHKGIVHMKLDADYRMLELVNMHPRSLFGKLKIFVLKKYVDIYTAESKKMTSILRETWGLDIKYLPNGYFSLLDKDYPLNYEDKKYFLTVGRLGTEQKATEVLLEAYAKIKDEIDIPLALVGPIEKEFYAFIQNYFKKYPMLEEKVIFYGEVSEERELINFYDHAVLFLLPSRWESFGLVLLEALDRGLYLIVTDSIPAIYEIGNDGAFCTVVQTDNVEELADAMLNYSQLADNSVKAIAERSEWVKKKYSWSKIAEILNKYVEEIRIE